MIATYQALAVALISLLPGASYTFAVERSTGSYGVKFSDRLVRFLAFSAVFHALISGPEYLLYGVSFSANALVQGHVHWWVVELVALVYVFVPIMAGTLVARLRRSELRSKPEADGAKCIVRRWRTSRWAMMRFAQMTAKWIIGDKAEPRAWDWMFNRDSRAILRIKLKSGPWLAGFWGTWSTGVTKNRRSYAAGYPEDGDLYLPVGFQIDSETGELVGQSGKPVPVAGEPGILVRWDQIEYIDFVEF